MIESSDDPAEVLEPISYLSRSGNRVQILDGLTETIPKPGQKIPGYEPRELQDRTGASEATVNRILNEFQERGWAERGSNGTYAATPVGQGISIVFAPILDAMDGLQQLGENVALLPLTELSIGLQHFRDATVIRPEGPYILEMNRYLGELTDEASTMYTLGYVPVTQDAMDRVTEQVVSGELDAEYVQDRAVREYRLTRPDQTNYREQMRSQLAAGAEIYTYDGHVPCNLWIYDETVIFENSQVEGIPDGTMIKSRNEAVREWAIELFERYRTASEEITAADIPE